MFCKYETLRPTPKQMGRVWSGSKMLTPTLPLTPTSSCKPATYCKKFFCGKRWWSKLHTAFARRGSAEQNFFGKNRFILLQKKAFLASVGWYNVLCISRQNLVPSRGPKNLVPSRPAGYPGIPRRPVPLDTSVLYRLCGLHVANFS